MLKGLDYHLMTVGDLENCQKGGNVLNNLKYYLGHFPVQEYFSEETLKSSIDLRKILVTVDFYIVEPGADKTPEKFKDLTAWTEGINIYIYGPFLHSLTREEALFVLYHEAFHILQRHPQRSLAWLKDNVNSLISPAVINACADYIVNRQCLDAEILTKDMPIHNSCAIYKSYNYESLEQLLDTVIMSSKAEEPNVKTLEPYDTDLTDEITESIYRSEVERLGSDEITEKEKKIAEISDPKEELPLDASECADENKALRKTTVEVAPKISTLPARDREVVPEMSIMPASWQYLFKHHNKTKDKVDYKKPSRFTEDSAVHLPGRKKSVKINIAILIDLSGSIDTKSIKEAIKGISTLIQSFPNIKKVQLIQFTDEILMDAFVPKNSVEKLVMHPEGEEDIILAIDTVDKSIRDVIIFSDFVNWQFQERWDPRKYLKKNFILAVNDSNCMEEQTLQYCKDSNVTIYNYTQSKRYV